MLHTSKMFVPSIVRTMLHQENCKMLMNRTSSTFRTFHTGETTMRITGGQYLSSSTLRSSSYLWCSLPIMSSNVRDVSFRWNTTIERNYSKFTARRETFSLGIHPLSEERAHDLICTLKGSELNALRRAMETYDAGKLSESGQGKDLKGWGEGR